MYEVWSNPASWTTQQWMAVCIMGFVILAIVVMIYRLLAIVNMSKKQKYTPNLRRLRKSAPTSAEQTSEESDESQ
ncbi:MAG: hypothetical protein JKY98_04075 [Gammaproteobacteria bacterium]|nr:hypothetical protein [Gammaproteobacteria bacterium]